MDITAPLPAAPFGSQDPYELAVIGGGIIGAGIARDAALRGIRTVLIEKYDLGAGTTSGSTRLIHGGLRYLEMFDFGLVRMDLRERETLLRIAPHLVKPLRFLLPYIGSSWFYRTKMHIGLALYDLLSYDKSLPNRADVSAEEIFREEPAMRRDKLTGASSYYDAQVNMPERLCLENALDAARHGAEVLCSTEVLGVLKEQDRVTGVRVRNQDGMEESIHARVVVNASGPWLNELLGRIQPGTPARIRATKGVHLAVESLNRHAWVLFSPIDGRLFFVIPWMGTTWIGTTDTDYDGDPGKVSATPDDIEYLLRSAEHYFPQVRQQKLCFTNAGVRALVMQEGSESSVSRSHQLTDGRKEGQPGLVTVLGGKITGYRAIAEETTDLIASILQKRKPCATAEKALPGGGSLMPEAEWRQATASFGISASSAVYLQQFYGSRAMNVLEIVQESPELAAPLAEDTPEIAAQVRLAVRTEFCQHLDDFLARRTGLAFRHDQGRSAAEAVASLLAKELGWDNGRLQSEWQRWNRYLARTSATGVSS